MTKYTINAQRTHWYTVEVEANSEQEALEEIRDWISYDFEDFETKAQWDFEIEENE
jgi:hypothetical protein